MDVVRENGQAYVKRILNHKHGLNISQVWMLLLLFLLLSYADAQGNGEELVETCIGRNAYFFWNYEVQPFDAVAWYFRGTEIAVTSKELLSQDFLSIIDSYTSRFVLLEKNKVGFSLTNVNGADQGEYTVILALKNTSNPVELKITLNITDCNTHRSSTIRSGEGTTTPMPTPAGEGTTTPKPTLAEDANTLAIVLGVLIPCLAIGVFGLWRWRRNRSPNERDNTEAGRPMTV